MDTIHDEDCRKLKEQLGRIEALRNRGRPASNTVVVSVDLAEDLIQDHEDLDKLLKAHPELKSEVPYA